MTPGAMRCVAEKKQGTRSIQTSWRKFMKNTVFALAFAAAGLAAAPAFVQAQEGNAGNSAFFINGNVGQSNLSKGAYDDSDVGFGVNAGYRWAFSPNVAIGVEGGYTDLGSFKTKDSLSSAGVPDAKVSGWTAGVNGHFNINPNWYISARGGLFRADIKGTYFASSDGTAVHVDDTSTKYFAGAGFGYDFSNNFSVGLNYDYYKADKQGLNLDPSLVSVSGEYRF
jgi:OOP family OmpA-OmpF porin/outer membrane immunogenic protein